MPRAEIILEGGPMHGYRVPRADGEFPLTFPCDVSAKPRTRAITFPIYNGPRIERAVYMPTGRYRVEFAHDTPIYAYEESHRA